MADSDVSLDREGQRAVDGAQEADVSGGQKVGQHVDAEHLKAGLEIDCFLGSFPALEDCNLTLFLSGAQ